MPVEWEFNGKVTCDAEECTARLTVSGATQPEAIRWIKASGWTYRRDIEGDLHVYCPAHRGLGVAPMVRATHKP